MKKSGLIAVLLLTTLAVGCAPRWKPVARVSEEIPTLPAWKAYVESDVQRVVSNAVKTSSTAVVAPPRNVDTAYYPNEDTTEITAIGDLDAQNLQGATVRSTYFATWVAKGRITDPNYAWGGSQVMLIPR